VERGEDALRVARRELLEETSLSNSRLRLCGIVTIDTEAQTGGAVRLPWRIPGRRGRRFPPAVPSSESRLEWVSWKELDGLLLVEDLKILSSRQSSRTDYIQRITRNKTKSSKHNRIKPPIPKPQ